jgi:hypothetical protein
MSIHPAVWKQVSKMYRWFYKTDMEIKRVFEVLNLGLSKTVGLDNLEDILNSLTYEEGIEVIKDVLKIEEFWLTQNDIIRRRNSRRDRELMSVLPHVTQPLEYVPPEHRLFGEQLCKLLTNFCEIVYDRQTNTLRFQSGGIHQIANIENSQLLIKSEFEDYFLTNISEELNGVYRAGFYNSTLLLARKLFENLLIKLLEHKYPKNTDGNLDLYFDNSKNRYADFSHLIKVLRDRKQDFTDGHSTVQRFITKLEKLTDLTNPTAHKLTYNASRDDVSSLDFQELLELYKIIAKVVSLSGTVK